VIKGNKHVPIVLPATEGVVHAGAGPNLSVEGIVRNAGLSFHNSTRVVGQCLRSAGRWSTGLKTERSIYNCMMRLISNARRFIYIENQYFCLGFREVGEEEVEEDEVSLCARGRYRPNAFSQPPFSLLLYLVAGRSSPTISLN
jgi:hypothetical protein